MKPNIFTKNILNLTLGFAVLSNIAQAQTNIPSTSNTYPTGSATVYTPANFAAGLKLNYVRTIVPTYAITPEWYLNPTDPGATRVTTNYYDGLGRLIQTVGHFASPSYNDIVSAVKYDQFGRDAYHFLPYSIAEGSADYNGKFKLAVYSDQKNFYKNQLGYTADNYFYSQTNYEASPLNTPIKSMQAGSSWVGSNRGTTVAETPLAAGANIRYFTITQAPGAMPKSAGVYGTAELMVKTTTDEDGFFTEVYTNKAGLAVLKATGKTGVAAKLLTYFVYDDFDLLRCTIPPKATEYLAANSWTMSATVFKELCFNYEYDGFSRMVVKNEPGVGTQNVIYNRKDQLQFTQSATQRAKGEWMFYKYDVLGRMVQTGLYMSTSSAQSMHGLSNNPYPGSDPFLVYLFKDTYGNASYVSSFTNAKVLTTNYYDDYSFTTRTFDQSQMFNLTAGFYSDVDYETKNYLTGTKTVVLDGATTPTELTSVIWYARNGMVLQTQAQNHKGGWTYTSNTYNFLNEKLGTYTEINNPQATNNASIKTNETYYYDHAGRSLGTDHDLNNAYNYMSVPASNYDEIGRLKTNMLASNTAFTINYEYNVRGWLTGINKGYCLVPNTENTFGMEISYNYGFTNKYFNGNIAGIKWRNAGANQELRAYGYKYDNYNRLQTADFVFKLGDYSNTNAWSNGALDFTASNITYDVNGNLITMKQMGKAVGGAKIILDDLTYGYTANTNKLVSVSESASSQSKSPTTYDKLGDFRDVAGSTDYTYDVSGNLLTDANKSITYTFDEIVNKTKTATKGTQTVTYLYDARGNKLQKKVSGGSTTTTTDYVGSAVFINNGLNFISHQAGRIRYNATATKKYMYDYFIKDHLGNTRSVVTYTDGAIEGFKAVDGEERDENPEIVYLATSEPENAAKEDQLFYNVMETRASNPLKKTEDDKFVARLSSKDAKSAIGPEITIKVMTGDKVRISAEALVLDEPTNPSAIAKDVVDNVILSIATTPIIVKEGIERIVTRDLHHLGTAALNMDNEEAEKGKVKAFLNYMLYDEDMKLIAEGSGSIQVKEKDGWQTLATDQLTIPQNGFLKVYTENKDKRTVSINNTTLAVITGKLVEEYHYYPFGLVFGASSVSPTSIKQTDFLFNGKELQHNEFGAGNGLELADYGARMYDSQIGRWTAPDPLGENNLKESPYCYVGNNPIGRIDPDGRDWWDVVAGAAIGVATNIIPGSTNLRNSYTPNDAADYNATLKAVDNTAAVAGAGAMILGADEMAAGGTVALAGAGASATGVGAVAGVPAMVGGGAVALKGAITAGAGAMLMSNSAANQKAGYDYGREQSKGSTETQKQSKVEKTKTTEKVGNFTKTTEVRPGKGPGQSRAEYIRYKNADGKTIKNVKDSYDRAGKFQHRKDKPLPK